MYRLHSDKKAPRACVPAGGAMGHSQPRLRPTFGRCRRTAHAHIMASLGERANWARPGRAIAHAQNAQSAEKGRRKRSCARAERVTGARQKPNLRRGVSELTRRASSAVDAGPFRGRSLVAAEAEATFTRREEPLACVRARPGPGSSWV